MARGDKLLRKGIEAYHAVASKATEGVVERFYGKENIKRGYGYTTFRGVQIGNSVYAEVPANFTGSQGDGFSPLDTWNLAHERLGAGQPIKIARQAVRQLHPDWSDKKVKDYARKVEFLANYYAQESGVKRGGKAVSVQAVGRPLTADNAPLYDRFRQLVSERLTKSYILTMPEPGKGRAGGSDVGVVSVQMDGEDVPSGTRNLSGRGRISEILPGKMRYTPATHDGPQGSSGSYLEQRAKGGVTAPVLDSKGRLVSGGDGVTTVRVTMRGNRPIQEATPQAVAEAKRHAAAIRAEVAAIKRQEAEISNKYSRLHKLMSGERTRKTR